MKRREFITLVGGTAAAWSLAAHAQQPARLPQVAILRSEVAGDPEGLRNSAALVQGLQALGWTQGRNVRIEQRWAGGSVDAMKALARELVALEPNVIVVISTPVTAAVRQETHTIPIIFVQNFDPVDTGFVKSLVAPGGNITGFTSYEPAMASKWLELVKGSRLRWPALRLYTTRKRHPTPAHFCVRSRRLVPSLRSSRSQCRFKTPEQLKRRSKPLHARQTPVSWCCPT